MWEWSLIDGVFSNGILERKLSEFTKQSIAIQMHSYLTNSSLIRVAQIRLLRMSNKGENLKYSTTCIHLRLQNRLLQER